MYLCLEKQLDVWKPLSTNWFQDIANPSLKRFFNKFGKKKKKEEQKISKQQKLQQDTTRKSKGKQQEPRTKHAPL
jgi:hypothetical protein